VKDTNFDVHIKVFKKVIRANKETVEADIINLNLVSFLKNSILEWGENFVQDHPTCTFEVLKQSFCKRFRIMKNDEKNYMQLKNLQQQHGEWVEVYYEHLLKLAKCLQVKATNVFLITNFKASLQPHLRLATIGMTRDTFIKHKEVVMTYEKNKPLITNYNVLLTQPKSKLLAQLIVNYITVK
jgi:hypothetical protein